MTMRKVLRFIIGVALAFVLLAVCLPFVGISSSHFLPPSYVYSKAQGETRGYVTGKFFAGGNNPFKIGANDYYINYEFRAHSPAPRGTTIPGPVQTYQGCIRVTDAVYEEFKGGSASDNSQDPTPNQVIPLPNYPVKIKFSKSNPVINGIDGTWAQNYQLGRNTLPGSSTMGIWMVWIVVAIVLGYLIALGLSHFMKDEDI